MVQTLFNLQDIEPPKSEIKSAKKQPKKQGKQTKAKKPKEAFIGKRMQTVQDVFKEIKAGDEMQFVTAGDWSAHELLKHCLEFTGPAKIYIATWSITEGPARGLLKLVDEGKITELNAIFDWRVKIRSPASYELAKPHMETVRLSNCHAKVFVIDGEKFPITVVGSANFTNNPRIEAGSISTSREIADFHISWIKEEIKTGGYFDDKPKNPKAKPED